MGRIGIKKKSLIIFLLIGVVAAGVLLFCLTTTVTHDINQTTKKVGNNVDDEKLQATLFLASDYQEEKGWKKPKENLNAIVKTVKDNHLNINGLILCGDYTNDRKLYNYQLNPDASIIEIIDIFKNNFEDITKESMIFVQGNHDFCSDLISESGLHEYNDYLVYVLNTENNFPWNQGKTTGSLNKVKETAANMKNCFDMLIQSNETRPVIIAGHVPLHFSGRTSSLNGTGDNIYSSLIFDTVNNGVVTFKCSR